MKLFFFSSTFHVSNLSIFHVGLTRQSTTESRLIKFLQISKFLRLRTIRINSSGGDFFDRQIFIFEPFFMVGFGLLMFNNFVDQWNFLKNSLWRGVASTEKLKTQKVNFFSLFSENMRWKISSTNPTESTAPCTARFQQGWSSLWGYCTLLRATEYWDNSCQDRWFHARDSSQCLTGG